MRERDTASQIRCHTRCLTSRRSQPPLPLRLQSTPRVGGGSAFYVRPLCTYARIKAPDVFAKTEGDSEYRHCAFCAFFPYTAALARRRGFSSFWRRRGIYSDARLGFYRCSARYPIRTLAAMPLGRPNDGWMVSQFHSVYQFVIADSIAVYGLSLDSVYRRDIS